MENVKNLELSFQDTLERVEDFPALAARAAAEASTLEDILVEKVVLSGADFSALELRRVMFRGCRFVDCDWSGACLEEVVSEHCDWTACRLTGSRLHRCHWSDCKGVGTQWARSVISESNITDCNLSGGNFTSSNFRQVTFLQTNLSGALLSQCRWKGLSFTRCRLVETSFFKTPMGGLDLTSCQAEGLIFSQSGEELKGLIVDTFQAAGLARRLGVVVRDAAGE